MRVVVTGALGNVGSHAVRALVAAGHTVRGFDLPTRTNQRKAHKLPKGVAMVWGDIRQREEVVAALANQEAIVHLAFILPPYVAEQPQLAEAINVGGTCNVVQVARQAASPPKLLFSSSVNVFGPTQDQPAPRHVTDLVVATDGYSKHKIMGEQLVRESGLQWAVLRFADVPPLAMRNPHPIMFRIPLENRFEVAHPADVGFAVAQAVGDAQAWGKIWLIGGGPPCQITYGQYLNAILSAVGIGPMPPAAFGHDPFYNDWMDTAPSEARWHYQRHTFDQIVRDLARAVGPARHLVPLARPFVRRGMLRMSPYLNRK